jgi:hypothetical protein
MPVRVLGFMITRAGRRIGLALLSAALVAGCGGETAAPVNVEGTVQARVSATVAAIVRAQPTATRPPAGTTVVPIGSPIGSPSPGLGTPAAGTATSAALSTPPAVVGTATPLRSPTAGGTAGATVTAAGGPAATQPAPLTLGALARVGGLSLTINRYEWNTNCPAGGGRASPGAKFVMLQASGRNEGSTAVTPSAAQWVVESVPAGSSVPCRPDGQPFEDACYRSGAIAPGARCEGWLLFEVPEQLDVPGAVVTARVLSGPSAGETGRWRIPT